MKRLPMACAALVAICVSGLAASAERHPGSAGQRYAGGPASAARQWLEQTRAPLRVQGMEFDLRATLPGLGGHTVRMQQMHGGLPVFGTAMAVRIGGAGEIKGAVFDVARGLTVSTDPLIEEGAARALVASLSGRHVGEGSWTELGVLPTRHGGKLVWRVNVPTNAGAWRYELDAHSGQLIRHYSLARNGQGRVYEVNNKKTPVPVDKELLNLTPSDPQVLAGAAELVARYVSGDLESQNPQLVVDKLAVQPSDAAKGDFLYDPATGWAWDDAFTEVNVYYHLDRMRTFYETTLGVDMSGAKWRLIAVPHYGPGKQPYANAFYTPFSFKESGITYNNLIAIGGMPSYNFAYDSDVFLHEYTHYVNQNAIGFSQGVYEVDEYGFVSMPGSLNEGSADYFSSTVNDDAVVGEASLGSSARNLDTVPGKCPDTMMGETHMDGELIGTASWAVRKVLGKELADPLVWGAMAMLTPSCTLGDFATNVGQGLQELKAASKVDDTQIAQIQAAFAARGLDDCGRFLSVAPDKSRTTNMIGLDMIAQYMGGGSCQVVRNYGFQMTSMFQFKAAPKSTDTSLRFHVDLTPIWGGGDDWEWDMYVRRNDGVTFQSMGMGGIEVDQFDHSVKDIKEPKGDIVIDAKSIPALDTTAVYHMIIVQRNCPSAKAVVTLLTEAAPEPLPEAGPEAGPPEAGPEPDAEQDGGAPAVVDDGSMEGGSCGCRTVGDRSSGYGAWAIGLAAGALLRRRRHTLP